MIRHRKAPKLLGCKIHKKHYWEILEPIMNYHDWMFTDIYMMKMEILPPTLDNLNLMREYHYFWVVKGFKNPLEFKTWNKIREKQGFYSMMYASRSVGSDLMLQAITAMLNKQTLPSQSEINQHIEDNKLIPVIDEHTEKRVQERERYRKLYERYTVLLQRNLFSFVTQGRLEKLNQ